MKESFYLFLYFIWKRKTINNKMPKNKNSSQLNIFKKIKKKNKKSSKRRKLKK